MENNVCNLKVILNHIENDKKIQNTTFNVYTFTEFESGKTFDFYSIPKIDFIEKIKILTESHIIQFGVRITDKKVKLIPLKVVS